MSNIVVSVENSTSTAVYDFTFKDFRPVTILDNQRVDLPKTLARAIVDAYPFLKMVGESHTDAAPAKISKSVQRRVAVQKGAKKDGEQAGSQAPENFKTGEAYLDSLKNEERYVCNQCWKDFDTDPKYRAHLKKSHNL